MLECSKVSLFSVYTLFLLLSPFRYLPYSLPLSFSLSLSLSIFLALFLSHSLSLCPSSWWKKTHAKYLFSVLLLTLSSSHYQPFVKHLFFSLKFFIDISFLFLYTYLSRKHSTPPPHPPSLSLYLSVSVSLSLSLYLSPNRERRKVPTVVRDKLDVIYFLFKSFGLVGRL